MSKTGGEARSSSPLSRAAAAHRSAKGARRVSVHAARDIAVRYPGEPGRLVVTEVMTVVAVKVMIVNVVEVEGAVHAPIAVPIGTVEPIVIGRYGVCGVRIRCIGTTREQNRWPWRSGTPR